MAADAPTQAELDAAVPDAQDDYPVVLGVPLNRILTIARGPINVAAGTLATWLLVHVHLFGLFHLQHDGLSTGIAQGVVWLVTAVLTDRGIAQWVAGHHLDMRLKAQERAPLALVPPPPPEPPAGDYDEEQAAADLEGQPAIIADDTGKALPISPDVER